LQFGQGSYTADVVPQLNQYCVCDVTRLLAATLGYVNSRPSSRPLIRKMNYLLSSISNMIAFFGTFLNENMLLARNQDLPFGPSVGVFPTDGLSAKGFLAEGLAAK
jgi:hypothetical protein